MPTYEYKCTDCDHHYETKEGFDAPPRQSCPRCGAVAKRVFFAPPIVFKGNGFYITDSRKGSTATIGAEGAAPSSSESAASNGSASNGSSQAGTESKAPAAAASSDAPSSSE